MSTFLPVIAQFSSEGQIRPLLFTWKDGKRYRIDEILDIRPAASLKSGGSGIRYTCRVSRQILYLFLDDNQWFYELP